MADGGGWRAPPKLAGQTGDLFRSPVWSQDGERVAFVRGVYRAGTYGIQPQIEILDLASNQRWTVSSEARLGPALAWVGDRVVYVLSEVSPSQNDSNLWSLKIDARTGKPLGTATRITSSAGAIRYLSSSANGKRLAYLKEGWQPDVYVARLEGNGTRLSTPRRLTLDERQDLPWSWTPDSKEVLFGSDRDGSFHIFRQAPDQTTPELLVGGSEQSMLPRLTPDGKHLVYLQYRQAFDPSNAVRMMRIPVAGGPPQLVMEVQGLTNEQCARQPSSLCLYALVGHAMPNADPVHKITIIPRGRALGYTQALPTEDKVLVTRAEMWDQLAMLLGGRTAEELVFHEPTTGAANDIEKASEIARGMVTQYGMSEKLGARKFGSGDSEPFLGMERSHARDYSEEIASAIDDEVRRLIESAHDEAWEVLVEYRDVLDRLVLQLLDKETLSRKEVLEVFATVQKRPLRGSYTGYGKRLPSDRPPVQTPKELALAAASDGKNGSAIQGNGQAIGSHRTVVPASLPAGPPPDQEGPRTVCRTISPVLGSRTTTGATRTTKHEPAG